MSSWLTQCEVLTAGLTIGWLEVKCLIVITPKIHRRRTPPQRKLNKLLRNDVSIQKKLSTEIENANLPVKWAI